MNDERADELLMQGIALHRQGKLQEAEAVYREILKHDDTHADALHWLGMLAFDAGDLPAALQLIDASLEQRPDEPAYHNHLAAVLLRMGDAPAAEQAVERALAIDANFAPALVNLGNAWRVQGRYPEAIDAFQRAVALEPRYADA